MSISNIYVRERLLERMSIGTEALPGLYVSEPRQPRYFNGSLGNFIIRILIVRPFLKAFYSPTRKSYDGSRLLYVEFTVSLESCKVHDPSFAAFPFNLALSQSLFLLALISPRQGA